MRKEFRTNTLIRTLKSFHLAVSTEMDWKLLMYRETKKTGNFWKTQQKLNKSNNKNLLTEIEPLLFAF